MRFWFPLVIAAAFGLGLAFFDYTEPLTASIIMLLILHIVIIAGMTGMAICIYRKYPDHTCPITRRQSLLLLLYLAIHIALQIVRAVIRRNEYRELLGEEMQIPSSLPALIAVEVGLMLFFALHVEFVRWRQNKK